MVAAPGSLLRRSGSGAQRSPLPSHATLPSLPPSAERWPSGRLKPPADVCPQVRERLSRRRTRSSSKRSRQRKLQRNNAMSKRARGGRGVNLWCFVPLRFSPFFAFVFRRFWRHRLEIHRALSPVGPAGASYRRCLGHVGLVFAAVPSAGAARGCVQLRRDPNVEKPPRAGPGLPGTCRRGA